MSSIQILCPYCRYLLLDTPEDLCSHVQMQHNIPTPITFKHFDNYSNLQLWLSSVEDSRSDGGVVGSDCPSQSEASEFYLLCRRRATPAMKRRRLNSPSPCTANSEEEETSIVSCTAFVHVEEKMDGAFDVRFCLDHCTNCEAGSSDKRPEQKMAKCLRKRTAKKRSSDSMSTDESASSTTSSRMSVESSPPRFGVPYVSSKDYENSRCSGVLFDDDDFVDVSRMNLFIDQKIDSTADRVRFITKVLADLAVDIGKCEESQNQVTRQISI